MQRTAVINVVGLTPSLIGEHTPRIRKFVEANQLSAFSPTFPALTCCAQSTYLTGKSPARHGIVGNGWYHRELAEIHFWKQSNHLVQGEKIWHVLKKIDPQFTCAHLFWWYNMYADVDYSITPRPLYPADGRKIFDVYTSPMDIRFTIQKELGAFPFPHFWGPKSGIASSRWIAAAAKWFEEKFQPTLSFVYLTHLDYSFQKVGPNHISIPSELKAIDKVVGDLLQFFDKKKITPVILSEYGITAVEKPVYLNRHFREQGWITLKDELGLEMLDPGASSVFAVADHQIAHIYVNEEALKEKVRGFVENIVGVEKVVTSQELGWEGSVAAERAGDLIAVAEENTWFAYYHWIDDEKAPDFARTVDIHRKPGYDPCELFIDPKLKLPFLKVAAFLLKKKCGFRGLLDVIPLKAELVKGSHGRLPATSDDYPVFIGPKGMDVQKDTDVFSALQRIVLR